MEGMQGAKPRHWMRDKDVDSNSKAAASPEVRMMLAPSALYFVPPCLHRIKGPGNLIPTERRPQSAAPPTKRGRLVLLQQGTLEPRKCRAMVGPEAGCGGRIFKHRGLPRGLKVLQV